MSRSLMLMAPPVFALIGALLLLPPAGADTALEARAERLLQLDERAMLMSLRQVGKAHSPAARRAYYHAVLGVAGRVAAEEAAEPRASNARLLLCGTKRCKPASYLAPGEQGALCRDLRKPTRPPSEDDGGPIRVGGQVAPPRLLRGSEPTYTRAARKGHVEGRVVLRTCIDEEGRIQRLRVEEGLPLGLSERAVKIAQSWRFAPATLDGAPVLVEYVLTFDFDLHP